MDWGNEHNKRVVGAHKSAGTNSMRTRIPPCSQNIRNQAYIPPPPSTLPSLQPGNWQKPLRGTDLPMKQRPDSWMSTHQAMNPTLKTTKTKKLRSHTLSFQSIEVPEAYILLHSQAFTKNLLCAKHCSNMEIQQ